MKTAISIPNPVFEAADRLARRLGVSRSELYVRAIAAFLDRHRRENVTATLDRVYGTSTPSQLPRDVRVLQDLSVPKDRW
jgi:metal-responsive CopG/Arc/MetJ family transcriptional regulator